MKTSIASDVCIIAAEASSALYAQRLLEHWRDTHRNIKAFGIGSQDMAALGFDRIGKSEEMAVVGIAEVLKHYRQIKSVFYEIIEQVRRRSPNVILLMDYPDFNLRLARALKPLGIPIVYYISPQIWAWRKSRIHQIRKYVDKMLVVLPFEKDFYASHGVEVEFVGHPLLDELKKYEASESDRLVERRRYGIRDDEVLIGLMPGSRQSELRHHFVTQLQVAEKLHKAQSKVKFAVLVAPSFSLDQVRAFLPVSSVPVQIIRDEPLRMVQLTDLVICASGTATLIVGLLQKPMVIMYRMNLFSAWLAKLFVKGTPFFGLINLILNKKVVPELFQEQAHVDAICSELLSYINDPEYRLATKRELAKARTLLGNHGATIRVARALDEFLVRASKHLPAHTL